MKSGRSHYYTLLDIRVGEFHEHDDHDDVVADDVLVHLCTSC